MPIPQELLDATITVLYLNEPKQAGWSWSVKDKDGAYWGCKDDIAKMLSRGATVDIQYAERRAQGGKVFKDIKRIVPRKIAPQANGVASHAPGNNDRAIFVTGVVQRAMGSGKFGIEDIMALTLATGAAFDALHRPHTAPRPQARHMETSQYSEPGDAYEPPMDERGYEFVP